MRRVKFLKPHKHYKVGETATVSRNEAFGLIDAGIAMIAKDIVQSDYTTKVESGNNTKLRTNKSRRRQRKSRDSDDQHQQRQSDNSQD